MIFPAEDGEANRSAEAEVRNSRRYKVQEVQDCLYQEGTGGDPVPQVHITALKWKQDD